ncbi:MAG: glycosyltransferase family 4 protein [Desulfobaccales bacterium]
MHITTVPQTFGFFQGQIGYMKARGVEVHAVSSPGRPLEEVAARENIPVHAVEMPRRITLLTDLVAIFKLCSIFRKLRPTIVHAHTPKGGLLGMVAARLVRTPVAIYTMHGLPFITARGLKRRLLRGTETISCRLADRVFAVSQANRQRALAEGFSREEKIKVLGAGSCNGVDAAGRFNPQKLAADEKEKVRRFYRIPPNYLVLAYVGRIVRDKGIVELNEAWQSLRQQFPRLSLLLIGHEEPQDQIPREVSAQLKADPRVIFTGWLDDPMPLYAIMDIMVLPTYREGFPISPLEAAAMQVPVVATTADGCVEAVADGVTGFLVPPGDYCSLAERIEQLLLNPELRERMGKAGRLRVLSEFQPERLWELLYDEYLNLMKSKLG